MLEENVKIGTRVVAIQSLSEGHLKSFGEGEYIGEFVPDAEPFKTISRTNPCIKLDSGKHVWGFMCWWGEKGLFEGKYGPGIKSSEVVDLPEEVGIWKKPAIDLAEKLIKIHRKDGVMYDTGSNEVVYNQSDIIQLLQELGHPVPDFEGFAESLKTKENGGQRDTTAGSEQV